MSRKRNLLLLNSSHARFPLGGDSWVTATLSALERLDPGRHCLVTSLGLPGWELTAWAAGRAGFNQKLVLPGQDNPAGRDYFNRCLHEFRLSAERTQAVFSGCADSRRFPTHRDRLVFELADLALPVSVRPGGRLEKLLAEYEQKGGAVDRDYQVKFSTGGWKPDYRLDISRLNPELVSLDDSWLFHWTHSHPGLWPGETPADYYSDLCTDPGNYVRGAAATLARIAREGLIRGSSFHKAGGELLVSLTALPPAEAIPLMRWRSRYRRWSFEPYGLALRKSALLSLGVRQVRYFDTIPADFPERDRPFSQLRGKVTDWRTEAEWRVHGDIQLGTLDPRDILLLPYDSAWQSPTSLPQSLYKIFPLFST